MSSEHSVHGLILAGGRSVRMGRDKAAIPIAGRPQLYNLVDLLIAHFKTVRVSVAANSAHHTMYRGLDIVEDLEPDHGPIAGIAAAYRIAPSSAHAVFAVDLMGLNDTIINQMLSTWSRMCDLSISPPVDAVAVATDDGSPDPLCCIWAPDTLRKTAEAYNAGSRSPRRILRKSRIELVHVADGTLHNVNTPEELERVGKRKPFSLSDT